MIIYNVLPAKRLPNERRFISSRLVVIVVYYYCHNKTFDHNYIITGVVVVKIFLKDIRARSATIIT